MTPEEEEAELIKQHRDRPFKGMLSYQDTPIDRKLFGGRDKEGRVLIETIKGNVLTVFYGHSGTGKTSLLNALAIPKLRDEGYIPVYIRLSYDKKAKVKLSLVDQVKNAIVSSEVGQATNEKTKEVEIFEFRKADANAPAETLWEYFTKYSTSKKVKVPILIFDAFEEIFTIGSDFDQEVQDLIQELHYLIEHQFPELPEQILKDHPALLTTSVQKFRVLITLREDYLPQLNRLRNKIYSIDKAKVGLDDIAIATIGPIIRKIQEEIKAEYFDKKCIEALKEYLKSDAVNERGRRSPVSITLGLVCYQLNERRIGAKAAKIDEKWLSSSEIRRQFGVYYAQSVSDKKTQRVIEEELINKHGYRLSVPKKFLIEEKDLSEDTLKWLVEDRRILRYEKRLGNTDVEIVHDSLAKNILQFRRERADARRTTLISLLIVATTIGIVIAVGFTQNYVETKVAKADSAARYTADTVREYALRVRYATLQAARDTISRMRDMYEDSAQRKQVEQELKNAMYDKEMLRLEAKAREDLLLLDSKVKMVETNAKRHDDSTQRVAFARLMSTHATGNVASATARTEAMLAFDTLKRWKPKPIDEQLFPMVYEAMVASMMDSIRTPASELVSTYNSRVTGARVLPGRNDDYYYSFAQYQAQKRSKKGKLLFSSDVRTWIGPAREQLVALYAETGVTRYSFRIPRAVNEKKNINFILDENETIESFLFSNNDSTLLLSTRNLHARGGLYIITPDTLVTVKVELSKNEFLMLDYADSGKVVAISNKGRYFKPRAVPWLTPFGDAQDSRVGLGSEVTCISYSSKRRSTLIGLENGQVHEINGISERKLFNNLEGSKASRVTAVGVSKDGTWIGVGYYKGGLILLNSESSEYAQIVSNNSFGGESMITSIFFVNKDQFMAAASDDGNFYHIPTSTDYLRDKLCSDGIFLPPSDWLKNIRQNIDPRNLCKPIK